MKRTRASRIRTWFYAVLPLHELILDRVLERGRTLCAHREAESHDCG